MMIFCYNLLPIIILGRAKITAGFANSESMIEKENQYCVCVPYWQCKEDYSGLIEDGIDIIDVRLQVKDTCTGDFDVCCQVECGKRKSPSTDITNNKKNSFDTWLESRILGENNEAGFAEFPWMLGILEDKSYRCGASLIHPQVALTAAHCITNEENINVRAGEWNWSEKTEPLPHQDRKIKKIISYPLYHPASLRNDIALLVLQSPFKLTENVGLACLPPQNSQSLQKKCIVTGWGKNAYNIRNYQSTLKKMELPMVSRESCLKSLQNARLGPLFNLHKSFICAGGEPNKDACKGDGGGPLICPIDGQAGRYAQVGIVSWGLTCGVQNTPGVYVNVGLFRDWIDSTMELLDFDTGVYGY